MKRIVKAASSIVILALVTAAPGIAQMQEGYLDVLVCKVKPEKRADFDALVKKMADANRRHKNGDQFLVTQTEYGEGNTVKLISTRQDYAAIEAGQVAFEEALKEAYGEREAEQMDRDFEGFLANSRAELRRRRWDLSSNAPSDAAAYWKLIGESRWIRTVAVHVRPGRTDEFEAQVRAFKTAMEKSAGPPTLVSQSVAGERGTVFYLSTLRSSLAAFDAAQPPLREMMGEEGYRAFQKGSSENVQFAETTLSRFLPELSNPPKQIVDASPDFWAPKPPASASKGKSKPKPPAN